MFFFLLSILDSWKVERFPCKNIMCLTKFVFFTDQPAVRMDLRLAGRRGRSRLQSTSCGCSGSPWSSQRGSPWKSPFSFEIGAPGFWFKRTHMTRGKLICQGGEGWKYCLALRVPVRWVEHDYLQPWKWNILSIRERSGYQIGWISGKVPKGGGGVIFNPKIYVVAWCQAKSNISIINSTVNNNKKNM